MSVSLLPGIEQFLGLSRSLLFRSWPSLCSVSFRSFLVLFGLTNSHAALLAQGQTKLCFRCVIMGLWGTGSSRVKSPSWGPADWIGVPGRLEVEV